MAISKLKKPTPETVHKANMGGLWAVVAMIMILVGLVVSELDGDDGEEVAMMYAEPAMSMAAEIELAEMWAEMCVMQAKVGVEQNERCE